MMKFKKIIEDNFRSFPMRKMPDVFELDNIFLRGKKRAEPFDQMFARHFIFEPVNHPERLAHPGERTDPALTIFSALGHIADEFVRDSFAAIVFEKRRKIFQLRFGRLRFSAENRGEAFFENRVDNKSSEQKSDWADKKFLRRNRAMS